MIQASEFASPSSIYISFFFIKDQTKIKNTRLIPVMICPQANYKVSVNNWRLLN